MLVCCAWCGKDVDLPAGNINRSRKIGMNLFCGRKHAGLFRRTNKTKAQKVVEKRAYDLAYRAKNIASIKAKKRAHFKATYDPVAAAAYRKKRMPMHVEYCRQPEYKKWKSQYDRQYLAKKCYGPFAEAAMLTVDLNRSIKERSTNYDIRQQNKTANKTQRRAREAKEEERSRPRHRERRRGHQSAHGG